MHPKINEQYILDLTCRMFNASLEEGEKTTFEEFLAWSTSMAEKTLKMHLETGYINEFIKL